MRVVKKLQEAFHEQLAQKNPDLSILNSVTKETDLKQNKITQSDKFKSIYQPYPFI